MSVWMPPEWVREVRNDQGGAAAAEQAPAPLNSNDDAALADDDAAELLVTDDSVTWEDVGVKPVTLPSAESPAPVTGDEAGAPADQPTITAGPARVLSAVRASTVPPDQPAPGPAEPVVVGAERVPPPAADLAEPSGSADPVPGGTDVTGPTGGEAVGASASAAEAAVDGLTTAAAPEVGGGARGGTTVEPGGADAGLDPDRSARPGLPVAEPVVAEPPVEPAGGVAVAGGVDLGSDATMVIVPDRARLDVVSSPAAPAPVAEVAAASDETVVIRPDSALLEAIAAAEAPGSPSAAEES
ncbi:MAG: hypothetical protein V7637_5681, partial [Mycobacteriales bacterium]